MTSFQKKIKNCNNFFQFHLFNEWEDCLMSQTIRYVMWFIHCKTLKILLLVLLMAGGLEIDDFKVLSNPDCSVILWSSYHHCENVIYFSQIAWVSCKNFLKVLNPLEQNKSLQQLCFTCSNYISSSIVYQGYSACVSLPLSHETNTV